MRRDWDVVRDILLEIEKNDRTHTPSDGWTRERGYHVGLLLDAGLVTGLEPSRELAAEEYDFTWMPGPALTWQGHDFLDAIRDETVWKKTKERTATVGGAVTISVLVQLATQYLKEQLGMN